MLASPTRELDHYILALRAYAVLTAPDADTTAHVVLRTPTTMVAVRALVHPIDNEIDGEDLPTMGMPRELEVNPRLLSLL